MNKLHTRRRAKNERKNDQSNWIRAFILIFIMASSQTYFSHLPSNYVSDEWAENVDLMSHDAKHEIVMETTKKLFLITTDCAEERAQIKLFPKPLLSHIL